MRKTVQSFNPINIVANSQEMLEQIKLMANLSDVKTEMKMEV